MSFINDPYSEIITLGAEFEAYTMYGDEQAHRELLRDACEFINLTVFTKKRVNEILLSTRDHYEGE